MLKKILLSFILSMATLVNAADVFNAQDIRDRLQVNGDIYLVDQTWKKILAGPDRTNYWRLNPEKKMIAGGWSSNFNGGTIAIDQSWVVNDDGTIKVTIEEFSKEDKGNLSGSLGKKEFILENFEPIVWRIKNIKDKNYILRLIPSLRDVSPAVAVDNLPIATTDMTVSDNNGYLWGEDLHLSGKYIGFTTHRGSLAISYVPFKDAKEIGFAEGDTITVNLDKKLKVSLKSASAFLPASITAKVYGIYRPDVKSRGVNSVHSFSSNKEDRIKEIFKK